MDILPPDEIFTAAEAAVELRRSSKQVRRYLESGKLRGTRASGHWQTTALAIWHFLGIAEEMLENWRRYCIEIEERAARSRDAENVNENNN